jgi:hypothetical protein
MGPARIAGVIEAADQARAQQSADGLAHRRRAEAEKRGRLAGAEVGLLRQQMEEGPPARLESGQAGSRQGIAQARGLPIAGAAQPQSEALGSSALQPVPWVSGRMVRHR